MLCSLNAVNTDWCVTGTLCCLSRVLCSVIFYLYTIHSFLPCVNLYEIWPFVVNQIGFRNASLFPELGGVANLSAQITIISLGHIAHVSYL